MRGVAVRVIVVCARVALSERDAGAVAAAPRRLPGRRACAAPVVRDRRAKDYYVDESLSRP